ncbi:MAG: protein kinase domain-containing protein [Candidatus Hydrothermia bacterium]
MIIPENLGKYRIKEFLGSGAFGFVYLAEDTLLGRDFALKIQKYRGEKGQELIEEARILFELNHENIVRFYNIEIIDDKIVLVMEPVKGLTLRNIIEQNAPLPYQEALEYIREILKALEYAHNKGLIHGDIKPENVLISEETGKIKLADFGLAKIFKGTSLVTRPQGTPFYMAPEAWRGEISTYSDIYSVGCILCELLSGKPPFFSENLEELRNKVFNAKFDKLPGVSPEINDIIRKTLSKVPTKRPTASELLADINKILRVPELSFVTVKTMRRDPFFGSLTEEQIKFVEDHTKILLLKGVVGSGKTTALAYKVAYFIEKLNFEPSSFLFMTFTGKAVNIFRGILEKIIGEEIASQVTCMTFHQFGDFLLRYGGERIGIPEDFRIISDKEAETILASLVGNSIKAKSLLREIKRAKGLLITPKELIASEPGSTWNQEVKEVYQKYRNILRERGLLDYEDLIVESLNLLRTYPDIRKDLQERFRIIIVDEFQDVNKAIFELIKDLVGSDTYLWASGDEAQSIYSFRGASPFYFKTLPRIFSNARIHSLTTNFRTSRKILDAGINLLSHVTKGEHPQNLNSLSSQEGLIVFSSHEDENKEAKFVAQKIKDLKEEGYDYSDIAVIYRTNEYSRALEDALKRAEIPYTVLEGGSFYELPEIEAFLGILEFLMDRFNSERWGILLKLFFKIPPRVLQKLLKNFHDSGKLSFTGISDVDLGPIKDFHEFLLKVKKDETMLMLKAPELMEKILGKLQELPNVSPKIEENLRELIYSISELNLAKIEEVLNYVSLMREFGLSSRRHHGVLLLTAHRAKGLEFPVVFIIGLIDGLFPLGRHRVKAEHLDEERRLLFVALTRAQERVYLSYPLYYRGTRADPSPFIYEMTKRRT